MNKPVNIFCNVMWLGVIAAYRSMIHMLEDAWLKITCPI